MTQENVATDFDPSQTNGVYDLFAPAWRMCRDFAEMHEHVLRSGEYLDRFGAGTGALEPASQYGWRTQAGFAMDYCADLIDLRVGNLFRTAPVRTFQGGKWSEFIGRFVEDVDGGGTHLDAFMARALRQYYISGVDIVVDKTRTPEGAAPETRDQEAQLGRRPYLAAFSPLERVDWACDHAGGYKWVRYDLGSQPPAAEDASPGDRRYLTLTADQWRLYQVSEDGDEPVQFSSGPMRLGLPPVISFYYRQSVRPDYRGVPLSLLTRIAPVARALLNLVSQGQLDIYMAIGVLAAIGVDADRLPKEMAPMCWLGLPDGAQIQHIHPAVEHVQEKRKWIAMLSETILRMGKLIGASGKVSARATSGFQVAAERTDLDNEMSATAAQAEAVERDIIRLAVSRMEGRLVDHAEIGYSVEYNKKYVLAPAADIVAQAREFFATGLAGDVPQISRLFLGRILDSLIKKDDPRYTQIAAAIENANFDADE
ncbi:MAG: hypothetical protein HN350_09225 [Phycisphaerales bacterium]|jgi:hypothetical protein|nr:hypothetical protein [Phycisphaerales bacterium]